MIEHTGTPTLQQLAEEVEKYKALVTWYRKALEVAGLHCEIRKCQACGDPYSKGLQRPCGHDEDSK